MHMLIYALVEASAQKEALATGKTVFDRLVEAESGGSGPFDYYVTFDERGTQVAGRGRWGDFPVAARIESEEGQELLEQGWKATKEEFQKNLDVVREALDEYTDEQIMRNEDQTRCAFYQIGVDEGPSVFLYTEHATGIRHREQLDQLLEEADECWIVPADVHF